MPHRDGWIGDAAQRSWDEARAFVATGLRFTFQPARFGRAWIDGRSDAPNPLGVLATGAATLAASRAALDVVLGRAAQAQGLWQTLLEAVAPFAHYLALATVAHLILALLVRGRQRYTDSVAMALYAGGGPGVLAPIVVYVVGAALWFASGRPAVIQHGLLGSLPFPAAHALLWVSYAGYALFLWTLLLALQAVHRAALWQAALALALAVFILGLGFGLRVTDVPFGTRILVKLRPFGGFIWVD